MAPDPFLQTMIQDAYSQRQDELLRLGLALLEMKRARTHDTHTYAVLKSMYEEISGEEWKG